jgi:hypothetical protein
VALNEEKSRYIEDRTSYVRFYSLDFNTFKRRSDAFIVDSTYNENMFTVATELTHLTISFVGCQPNSQILQKGTGFRVIVLKEGK